MTRSTVLILRLVGIFIEVVGLTLLLQTRAGNAPNVLGHQTSERTAWVIIIAGFAIWLLSMIAQVFVRRRGNRSSESAQP